MRQPFVWAAACAGLYAGNLKTKGGGGGGGAVVGYFGIATKASSLAARKLKFQTLLLLEF